MGKKRKLEKMASLAASEEHVSDKEESTFNEDLPDIRDPIIEQSLIEEDLKTQAVENTDPDQHASGVDKAFPTDFHEDEKDNDPESLDELLEPFSKDQVVDLLREAATKHPDIWAFIRQTADADPAHRKIFVHGLGWNATAETLIDAFRQFGEIEDCNAIVDKATGRCKGYGFILFKHRSGARLALKEPQKKIGNKMTACQLASAGPPPAPAPSPSFLSASPTFPLASEYTQRKIYVSNVGADVDPQKVLQFFSKYGEIEDGPLGLDKATGKPKGFCLFVYKSAESAIKALEEPHKKFEGHILHCQKAIDGPKIGKLGAHLLHGGGQYASMQHGQSAFGPHFGRVDTSLSIPGMSSSVVGPGHLIAPPAVSIHFNQAGKPHTNPPLGLAAKNGGFVAKHAFGNQAGGGSYMKPGVAAGYATSLRIQGSHGNAAVGQGSTWTQQGFSHTGGVGSSMGQ